MTEELPPLEQERPINEKNQQVSAKSTREVIEIQDEFSSFTDPLPETQSTKKSLTPNEICAALEIAETTNKDDEVVTNRKRKQLTRRKKNTSVFEIYEDELYRARKRVQKRRLEERDEESESSPSPKPKKTRKKRKSKSTAKVGGRRRRKHIPDPETEYFSELEEFVGTEEIAVEEKERKKDTEDSGITKSIKEVRIHDKFDYSLYFKSIEEISFLTDATAKEVARQWKDQILELLQAYTQSNYADEPLADFLIHILRIENKIFYTDSSEFYYWEEEHGPWTGPCKVFDVEAKWLKQHVQLVRNQHWMKTTQYNSVLASIERRLDETKCGEQLFRVMGKKPGLKIGGALRASKMNRTAHLFPLRNNKVINMKTGVISFATPEDNFTVTGTREICNARPIHKDGSCFHQWVTPKLEIKTEPPEAPTLPKECKWCKSQCNDEQFPDSEPEFWKAPDWTEFEFDDPYVLEFVSTTCGGDYEWEQEYQMHNGYLLTGEVNLKQFFAWLGDTNTSKSSAAALLKVLHLVSSGSYFAKDVQKASLLRKGGHGSAHDGQLACFINSRVAIAGELEPKDPLDCSLLNRLTGADSFGLRLPYGRVTLETKSQTKVVVHSNVLNQTILQSYLRSRASEAHKHRLCLIHFAVRFVDILPGHLTIRLSGNLSEKQKQVTQSKFQAWLRENPKLADTAVLKFADELIQQRNRQRQLILKDVAAQRTAKIVVPPPPSRVEKRKRKDDIDPKEQQQKKKELASIIEPIEVDVETEKVNRTKEAPKKKRYEGKDVSHQLLHEINRWIRKTLLHSVDIVEKREQTQKLANGIYVPANRFIPNHLIGDHADPHAQDQIFTWAVAGAIRWYNEHQMKKFAFPLWNRIRTERVLRASPGLSTLRGSRFERLEILDLGRYFKTECQIWGPEFFANNPELKENAAYRTSKRRLTKEITKWLQKNHIVLHCWKAPGKKRPYLEYAAKIFGITLDPDTRKEFIGVRPKTMLSESPNKDLPEMKQDEDGEATEDDEDVTKTQVKKEPPSPMETPPTVPERRILTDYELELQRKDELIQKLQEQLRQRN
jgi:hypothetical protein